MSQPILQGTGLHYTYLGADVPSLCDVNFRIYSGQRVAVLGPNGSGKSTLLLHLNGILKPTRGEVRFRGEPLRYDSTGLLALRRQVGLVFQNPDDQLFSTNVRQDLSFGPLNLGLDRGEVRCRVDWAAEATGIAPLLDRPIHALSYGQRMRVAIAGVLAMQPAVLIADEPTSSLDPQMAAQVIEIFNALQQQGTTILLATHDVDLAYTWADDVIILAAGEAIAVGSPVSVFSDERLLARACLSQPVMLQVWRTLVAAGVVRAFATIPRTCAELSAALANRRKDDLLTWLQKIQVGVETC